MLEIIPKELVFPEPAHTEAIVTLTLKNTGTKRTAYRIMTSAPHRFSVRPVFGLLKSHGIASILIQYRPADHSVIYPDYKFRIKAAPADHQYSANDPSNFWNTIPPDQILITTIRCTFPQPSHHAFSANKMPLATVAILPLEESATAKNRATIMLLITFTKITDALSKILSCCEKRTFGCGFDIQKICIESEDRWHACILLLETL
ncbi:vesicle-associated membrane protein-associated protein A-like isoform X5 [Paramacrobiotus metropolitanus]|uniref:vesicle-associated membrane protein-associated protein A-like isoform X5 n=1 Tax=Paramacrobiotus metropolitanus TaxID=2943436 RepID=UPI002446367D|nr:vesicle-associated membrane protein-associated protein A-like isoform X5 [Paramacrobiotus metropolitanus]